MQHKTDLRKPDPRAAETHRGATLAGIFWVFFRIGLLSFGGGLTGWVYLEIVAARQWMTDDEFMSGIAVSQILPGANVANLAIYVGSTLKGPIGAVAYTRETRSTGASARSFVTASRSVSSRSPRLEPSPTTTRTRARYRYPARSAAEKTGRKCSLRASCLRSGADW